jgi:hypothetical protein
LNKRQSPVLIDRDAFEGQIRGIGRGRTGIRELIAPPGPKESFGSLMAEALSYSISYPIIPNYTR